MQDRRATGRAPDAAAESGASAVPAAGPRPLELLLAWLALGVLAVIVFLPNVRDSGFSTDDWSNAATALQHGHSAAISSYADITPYRPVLILYVPLTYWVFGMHMGVHLAWSVALAVLVSGMLYAVLRECRLPRVHSGMVAALALLYPWADSTRMWPTASMASLAIGVALAGVWVALIGLRRGSWRFHVAAAALYALSMLTYELTVALVASAGLLYIVRAGWRAARWRWAADLAVVVVVAAWNSSTTPRERSFSVSALWHHFTLIVQEGGKLVARSAQPLGTPDTALVLLVLAAVAAAGIALAVALRDRPLGAALRPFAGLFVLGAAVTALGWVVFVPADVYYTPSIYGFTNRVNALAGVGLVMVVYAAAGMVGALVGALRPRTTAIATAVTLALGVLLGAGYVKVLDRHSDLWVGAFRGQMSALGMIKGQYPRLPDDSTVLTFNYPGYQAPGVPIFAVSWDLNAALKLQYDNPSLSGYPIVAPTTVRCERAGVLPEGGAITGAAPIPYGRAILFEVPTGRHDVPRDAAACRSVLPSYAPGAPTLSGTY